jgi:hypothetical protein
MFSTSKYFTIKARLKDDHFANFFDKFHLNKDDHFYKIIQAKCEEHLQISKIDRDVYKFPYTTDGFKFKSSSKSPIRCTINNKPAIIDDCFDRDVTMCLAVRCYDFIDKVTNIRIVGSTIVVSSIKVIKDSSF